MNDAMTLIQAAKLISAVASRLNLNQSKCGGCGVTHYDDFGQFQANKELVAAAAKIVKIAKSDSIKKLTKEQPQDASSAQTK